MRRFLEGGNGGRGCLSQDFIPQLFTNYLYKESNYRVDWESFYIINLEILLIQPTDYTPFRILISHLYYIRVNNKSTIGSIQTK